MPDLSSSSRAFLLGAAKASIAGKFRPSEEKNLPQELSGLKRGCFVTLKKGGRLRGCIGTFDDAQLLAENVRRMAKAAAFDDPRFPPVSEKELNKIRLEISVLGEFIPLMNPEDLIVGTHGVLIRCGKKSGTYLPEVAVEQGWNRDELILHCAKEKAGLSDEELKSASIFIYDSIKITDDQ